MLPRITHGCGNLHPATPIVFKPGEHSPATVENINRVRNALIRYECVTEVTRIGNLRVCIPNWINKDRVIRMIERMGLSVYTVDAHNLTVLTHQH